MLVTAPLAYGPGDETGAATTSEMPAERPGKPTTGGSADWHERAADDDHQK